MSEPAGFLSSAQRTIRMEAEAVTDLSGRLGADFERACELILAIQGRVIVTGMGKSGHIASKIAATLASTGTPA
ncbi:MAG: D-arabinose 5-phosphate isomerase, partial [Halieaceae bacterium]|nr:D-arabinose 5-phosphate isomerase [Halieaceae bacterium]